MITQPSRHTVTTSFTMTREMLIKLDEARGDVPRSRYILKLVEKATGIMDLTK